MTFYQISGLGAGKEVFKTIKLNCQTEFIPWIIPIANESIQQYAQRMAEKIDTSKPFALMGVSFGGIVCQEIAKIYPPKHLFLISTVTSRKELPAAIKFSAGLGLNKLIPKSGLNKTKPITHYLFGATHPNDKQLLNEITKDIDHNYLIWSTSQIGNWKQMEAPKNCFRFHGKQDRMFPAKKLSGVDVWLNDGHFASISEGSTIGNAVNEITSN